MSETNFEYSFDKLMQKEGGYSNHPLDYGGKTFAGITQKNNPKWYGWRYFKRGYNKITPKEMLLVNYWVKDYYLTIWVREGFDKIIDKKLAFYLFDYRVHARSGPRRIKQIAETMGVPINVNNKFIADDMIWINFLNPNDFIKAVRNVRVKHYKSIVAVHPDQHIWLSGWLNRTKIESL